MKVEAGIVIHLPHGGQIVISREEAKQLVVGINRALLAESAPTVANQTLDDLQRLYPQDFAYRYNPVTMCKGIGDKL